MIRSFDLSNGRRTRQTEGLRREQLRPGNVPFEELDDVARRYSS